MSDNKIQPGARDGCLEPAAIDYNDRIAIGYWVQKLHVSENDLRNAMQVVGSDVSLIKEFLAELKARSEPACARKRLQSLQFAGHVFPS